MTTVTTVSKTLALILFIALPFIGFYFGIQYQKGITPGSGIPSTVSTRQKKTLEDIRIPVEFEKDISKGNFLGFENRSSITYIKYEFDGITKELPLHENCSFMSEANSIQKDDFKQGDVISLRKVQLAAGQEQVIIVTNYSY